VVLSSTKLYDVCKPIERREWLDVFIALIEYLRSGESKVGFLNNSLERNMLHKEQEEKNVEGEVVGDAILSGEVEDVVAGKNGGLIVGLILETSIPIRKSIQKRQMDETEEIHRQVKARK
jgi:hypothetical protein